MANEELAVDVGANTKPLEKGLNDVTEAASKGGKNATAAAGGFIHTLGKAYAQFNIIFDTLKSVFDFVMKFANMARELRNLSVATGIPIGELRNYELQAKQAGISTQALAHSVAEFNKKMGEARIRGSEANAALAKLGFGLKDISEGSINHHDVLIELAKAYEAGTDEATLMHYAVQLFGSSAEQMLPLIKQGSVELKKSSEAMVGLNKNAANTLSNLSDSWDNAWQTMENVAINVMGTIGSLWVDLLDNINNTTAAWYHSIFSKTPEAKGTDLANDVFKQMSKGMTKEQQKAYFEKYRGMIQGPDEEEARKFYDARIKELTQGGGKKLTPLGLTEAQGASTLQQMGGGDIVSAIAFTPMERIAKATEETARNTAPKNEVIPVQRSLPIEAR